MKFLRYKKIIGLVLVLSIVISSFSFPITTRAADDFISQCVVGPLVSLAGSIGGGFLASIVGQVPVSDYGTHLDSCVKSLVDTALRIARNILKKRLLDQIVDQTVNWIQNPDAGEPRFITNFGGFLNDAIQAGIGDTIREVGLGEFCDAQVKTRLQITLRQPQRFSQGVTCTLDQAVGNISAFKNNFKNGSWIGIQAAADPRNNPLGVRLLAMEQVLINTEKNEKSTQAELLGGGGFIGQKTCNSWVLVDPISLLSVKDSSGQEIRSFELSPKEQPPTPPPNAPVDSYYYCDSIGEVIVTPADTIGKITSKTVGSDIDYILNADDFEAYITAIADAAINRLTNEAVSGLSGLFRGGSSPQRAGGTYTGYNDPRIRDAASNYNSTQNPNTVETLAISGIINQLVLNIQTASSTLKTSAITNTNILPLISSTSTSGLVQCMMSNPLFVPDPITLNTNTYLTNAQTRNSTTIPLLQTQIQGFITELNVLKISAQQTLDLIKDLSATKSPENDARIASSRAVIESKTNDASARVQTVISAVSTLKTEIDSDFATITRNLDLCGGN